METFYLVFELFVLILFTLCPHRNIFCSRKTAVNFRVLSNWVKVIRTASPQLWRAVIYTATAMAVSAASWTLSLNLSTMQLSYIPFYFFLLKLFPDTILNTPSSRSPPLPPPSKNTQQTTPQLTTHHFLTFFSATFSKYIKNVLCSSFCVLLCDPSAMKFRFCQTPLQGTTF